MVKGGADFVLMLKKQAFLIAFSGKKLCGFRKVSPSLMSISNVFYSSHYICKT